MTVFDAIPALIKAVPEFIPNGSDIEDNLSYAVFNDLIRFAFERDPETEAVLLKRIFTFLEDMFEIGDDSVNMLLRDVAWAAAEQAQLHRFKQFLGKRLRKFIGECPVGDVLLR